MLPSRSTDGKETNIREYIRDGFERDDFRHVVVIPDGVLHRLPFQALAVGERVNRRSGNRELRYLIDEIGDGRLPPISYATSIAALAESQTTDNAAQAKDWLLSVGGVPWQKKDRRLKWSEEECRRWESSFRGLLRTSRLTGTWAREDPIRTVYGPACRIFHFSDHAVFCNEHDNLFGRLMLYSRRPDDNLASGKHDNLEIHEICNLDFLGCELVVLSACQTAVGPRGRLEMGNSLARAFLAAGAKRVVASFWRVNDKAAFDLMTVFSAQVAREMKANRAVDYARALHTAMRELRNNEKTRSPYYWAPFALIGPPAEYHQTNTRALAGSERPPLLEGHNAVPLKVLR